MATANILSATNAPPLPAKKLRHVMEDQVSMSLVPRSRLVRISFDHPDRHFAVLAANAFAEAAESFAAEENRIDSDNAVAWLEAQAVTQRRALEKSDRALMEFSKGNQIDALERQKGRTGEVSVLNIQFKYNLP